MRTVTCLEFKILPIKNMPINTTYKAVHGVLVDAANGRSGSGSILTFELSKVTVGTRINHTARTSRPT